VPRWSSPQRAESERFARAVDHPTPEDDDFAAELALVGSLRDLGESGSPDEETRRRIRADIVERFKASEEPTGRRGRPVVATWLVAAAAALIALGGLSLVLSKNALPGDPLYNVKLAGESVTLGLTFGEQAKAEKHLEFADNRLGELAQLKNSGGDSTDYLTGLAGFESEARAGVSQLTQLATESGSPSQLTQLTTWAQQRGAELATESAAIPASITDRVNDIQSLLSAIQTRVTDLVNRMDCFSITSGSTDALGALPAEGVCDQRPTPHPAPTPTPSGGSETTSPSPSGTTELTVSTTTDAVDPATAASPQHQATSGATAPPVVQKPILPTTGTRPPTSTPTRPPLISIPPLLPGLPPIVIP
jgi:hypothetical protein